MGQNGQDQDFSYDLITSEKIGDISWYKNHVVGKSDDEI